jgi:hypothetical protein
MAEKTRNFTGKTALTLISGRRPWWFRLILILWLLQLAWLAWQLRGELGDIPPRLWSHSWGQAIRQEDPFHRWLVQLEGVILPDATYLFLDRYEAGKYIEARYHLFPRRQILFRPQASPSLLFHTVRRDQVSYLLVRDAKQPLCPGLKAAIAVSVAEPLPVPGVSLAFRVHPERVAGGFYD